MKVLLLSDNHGSKNRIEYILNNYEYNISIHLGDGFIDTSYLNRHFDYYVCGNNENFDPKEIIVDLYGIKTLIMHGHTRPFELMNSHYMSKLFDSENVDLILHGHTHLFKDEEFIDDRRVICPGSTDLPRGPKGAGFCIIDIQEGKIKNVEFFNIDEINY